MFPQVSYLNKWELNKNDDNTNDCRVNFSHFTFLKLNQSTAVIYVTLANETFMGVPNNKVRR